MSAPRLQCKNTEIILVYLLKKLILLHVMVNRDKKKSATDQIH